jgi:hypothetical protein
MLPEIVVRWLALTAPVAAAERCMGTDPAETPLHVRRFDGKVVRGHVIVMSRWLKTTRPAFIRSQSHSEFIWTRCLAPGKRDPTQRGDADFAAAANQVAPRV